VARALIHGDQGIATNVQNRLFMNLQSFNRFGFSHNYT